VAKRRFAVEFEVDDADIQDAMRLEQEAAVEAGDLDPQPEWTAVDIIGDCWATGEGWHSLRYTRVEEIVSDDAPAP
jgi:hypothetical protein